MVVIRLRTGGALFGAVLAVSSAAIIARECDAPAPTVAFYRMGLTAATILVFGLCRGDLKVRPDSRTIAISVMAGVLLGSHYIAWFASLRQTSVASSVVLVSVHPLVVAILSGRVVDERVGFRSLIAVLVATVGAVVVSLADLEISRDHFIGDLLALSAGVLFAGYFLAGRVLRRSLPLVPYMAWVYSVAALTVLLFCMVRSQPLVGFSPRTYGLFVLLAVVPTLVGHSLFNWALRFAPAYLVSVSQLGEPIGASVLAFVLLGEVPALSFYPAVFLILGGVFVSIRRS